MGIFNNKNQKNNQAQEFPRYIYLDKPEYMDSSPYKANDMYGLKITTRNEEEQKKCEKMIEEVISITDEMLASANKKVNLSATDCTYMYNGVWLVFNICNSNQNAYNKVQKYEPNWGIYITKDTPRFVDIISFHSIGSSDLKQNDLLIAAYSIKTNFLKSKDGHSICPEEIRKACLEKYASKEEVNKEKRALERNDVLDDIEEKYANNQKGWFVRE